MIRVALLVLILGCGSSSSPEPAKQDKSGERSAKLPAPPPPEVKTAPAVPPPPPEERGPTELAPQQVPAMKKRLAELDKMIAQARSDAENAGSASGRDTAAAELAVLQQQREELEAAIDTAGSGKARVPSRP